VGTDEQIAVLENFAGQAPRPLASQGSGTQITAGLDY
jgi:hypothetical protein